ncbi:MAG: hypothetical protein KBT46_02580, partial [Ruminococcus sp.]|nr:hypothetical protein [Candidatus Copronaster equi]
SKQNETASVFEKYMNDTNELKQKIAALQKEITKLKSTSFHQTDDNIIIFEDDCDMPNLRNLVLSGVKYTSKICAGFSGNDSDGYIYAMASEKINLREKTKEINTALCGKGGGSAELIQGNCRTSKNEINKFFKEV